MARRGRSYIQIPAFLFAPVLRSVFGGLLDVFKRLQVTKRQRFVLSVVILSLGLFFSENLKLTRSGLVLAFFLSFYTDFVLLWANFRDLKESYSPTAFILPFFYSLAFGLFYSLVPDRFITRVIMTSLYAVGLYSLFLSQNIFIVASIRTIALLSSARTVSFIITLLTYFFLANTILSLHLFIFPVAILIFVMSFFLISHALWIYTLERSFYAHALWSGLLSLALTEISMILWFWPTNPLFISLFLTGFFYTIVGLSHVWAEKRLFRGVLWEYIWVAVVTLSILVLFTFLR